MRRAYSNVEFIEHKGKVVGISLGYDHCAEHEWGIKPLKQALGIDSEAEDPWQRHCVTQFNDENVAIMVNKSRTKMGVLFFASRWAVRNMAESGHDPFDNTELKLFKGNEIVTAWDSDSFGIVVVGKENVKKLQKVYDAFMNKDIAQGFKGGGPFGGSGLVFTIESSIPEEIKEETRENHRSHERLLKAEAATGIKKKLEKAGCRYYALSPRWQDPEDESKGIRWWLNPMDQQNNKYGWYGLAQLELWALGRGPIPVKKEEKA